MAGHLDGFAGRLGCLCRSQSFRTTTDAPLADTNRECLHSQRVGTERDFGITLCDLNLSRLHPSPQAQDPPHPPRHR